MEKTSSPAPKKAARQDKLSFSEALAELLTGRSITKLEWDDKNYYGMLQDERLRLHKPDGQYYDWILSEGDMRGADWVVL